MKPPRLTIADHARTVLLRTENPGVMVSDCLLLDQIAIAAGIDRDGEHPFRRHQKVLNALERSRRGKELFRKRIYKSNMPQGERAFYLIELDKNGH